MPIVCQSQNMAFALVVTHPNSADLRRFSTTRVSGVVIDEDDDALEKVPNQVVDRQAHAAVIVAGWPGVNGGVTRLPCDIAGDEAIGQHG